MFETSFTSQDEYIIEDWLAPSSRQIIQKNKILDFENFNKMKAIDQENQKNVLLKKSLQKKTQDVKKQETSLEKSSQLGDCIVCKKRKRSVLLMPCSHFVCV